MNAQIIGLWASSVSGLAAILYLNDSSPGRAVAWTLVWAFIYALICLIALIKLWEREQ